MLRNSGLLCALLSLPALSLGCSSKTKSDSAEQEKPAKSTPKKENAAPPETAKKLAAPQAPLPVAELPADSGEHKGTLGFAVTHGSTDTDAARAIAIAPDGNVMIAGYFKGSGIFGTDYSSEDVSGFLAKLNVADGSVAWSVDLGGTSTNSAEALAVAADGSTVVVGAFSGDLSVGNGTLKSAGADDIFFAKIAADGHRLWAKRIGGLNIDAADSVAIDKAGNAYVTGVFRDKITVGEEEFKAVGDSDIFLLKLSPQGEFLWAKTYGAMGQDFGRDIAVDSAGNLLLLAEISVSVGFGGEALTTKGNRDIALVKLDANGEHIWSKSMGTSYDDMGIDVAIDPADNILLTGSFEDTINFGGEDISAVGRADAFLAKYDTNGSHLWSKGFGGKDTDWGNHLATDSHGNIYLTGWFWYDIDFGQAKLTSKGQEDAFLVKASPNGDVLWSKSFGNSSRDMGKAVAVTADGGVVTVGSYNISVDLGAGALTPKPGPDPKMLKGDFYFAKFAR